MKKKDILLFIILFLMAIVLLNLLMINKNSYSVKNARDLSEISLAKNTCKEIIEYLDNKYHEKFHVTFTWYSEEFGRLNYVTAYSNKHPFKKFSVSILDPKFNDGKKFEDNYLYKLAKDDVNDYFYNIFEKYNISKEDFKITNSYDLDSTEISKESFNKGSLIIFELDLDEEDIPELEKNMPNIAQDLNNAVEETVSDTGSHEPNFSINVVLKDKKFYDDFDNNENYLTISIYDGSTYYARRVREFPDDLFINLKHE